MRRRLAIVLLAALAPAPALAQDGPSFDCGKASNAVERTICKEPELAGADRSLAAAYGALLGKLGGPAKEHLQKDQLRWIANRNRACAGGSAYVEPDECLKGRYASRLAWLALLSSGPYAFISEQALVRTGKVKSISYGIDASYPQFDGPDLQGSTAGFDATNRFFVERTRAGAADAVPPSDVDADREQGWSYDQWFRLHRPVATAISVETSFYVFTGGAHGNGATTGTLVDLRSGRIEPPASVFVAGDEWRRVLHDLTIADLRKQFVERPGFDDALEPRKVDKMLADGERYVWRAGRLELVFNHYELAAYVMGQYRVEIPYPLIKALLRADGPLGSLR